MADNVGASFSRSVGNMEPALRRALAQMAEEFGSFKIGTIVTINTDHLIVQCLNENDSIRVDRYPFANTLPALPPYEVGNIIFARKVNTPRVADYPWIDLNAQGRQLTQFYAKPISKSLPMFTKAVSARSCSISLPLSDTFTDTNGTLLSAHYMNAGCGWSVLSGVLADWTIQSNKAQHSTIAANRRVRCSTDDTTHDVQISAAPIGTAATTVFIEVCNRVVDTQNFWFGRANVNATAANSSLAIFEVTSGTATLRVSTTTTIAMGENITLLFEDGNPGTNDLLLTMSGDRSGSVTYNSSQHSSGTGVGFGGRYDGALTTPTSFDNFSCAN